MADATFETYYAPGLGAKYATRAWVISAVILAIGVPVTWFTFVGNPQWWVLVLVGLVFAFLLAVTVSAARAARAARRCDLMSDRMEQAAKVGEAATVWKQFTDQANGFHRLGAICAGQPGW